MPKTKLDEPLLHKLAEKTKIRDLQRLRVRISHRASKRGISSAAAQIIWAQELGIGVAHPLSKLPAEMQEQVRRSIQAPVALIRNKTNAGDARQISRKKDPSITGGTIDTLLLDQQLLGRCKDLLLAKNHFDRAFREATTVLDDRLKKKSGIRNLNPLSLVGKTLNPDPQKAIIEVSAEKDEQEGFHSICKGVMLAFRNKAHHELSDKFTREDALKFCGFVDALLAIIEQGRLHPERG